MLKNDPHIGSPRNRDDGPAKVTGRATYAAEFAAPDLSHGYIVESAIPRGRILSIDTAAAEALPGVVKIFTHENRPRTAWFSYNYQDQVGPPGTPFRPLYSDEVHYSGQPIALVVATSFEAARDAAALVRVSYERDPHLTDLSKARNDRYEPPKKRTGIAPPPDPRGDAEERRRIIAALDANGWRRQDTAACLGISRKVLWEKMRKFQIADSEAEPV